MMNRSLKHLCLATSLTLISLGVQAQGSETDVQLLRDADRTRGGNLPGISWRVAVDVYENDEKTDSQGIQLYANPDAWVADFLSPNKIRGQRLLKRGKNMWFSSPNASKAVPISQRQRLSGGASNGDVASTNYARDYEIVSVTDESIDGKATRRFELRSKDSSVTYDQVRYWIDTKAKVGVKAEFLSKTGKLLKTAAFQYGNKIQYEGDTLPFVSQMESKDALNPAEVTRLSYSEIRVGSIPASKFAR